MWMKTGAFLPFMLFLFFPSVRAVIPKEEAFQGIPTSQDAPLAITDSSGQEYLFRALKNRRTVRKYKPIKVPREDIIRILDAARYAPTAGNQQPWKFLVIEDREKLDRLCQEAASWYLNRYTMEKKPTPEELEKARNSVQTSLGNILSASTYIAVLVDSSDAKYPRYLEYDGTLAAGYLMIAARALGYGTGFFVTFFPENEMKAFFRIPDHYRLICFTPIGIPAEWPLTPPKKDLKELVVFESF
ncbi:MAG: hypothetical protein A2W25_11530 [candidate division Zixibacteria bacterium RBG_16_53_22]|nr:MAG: hypothetical protein A2W25_11530 [candidate division Zixibacteria bacterium RBG_16_53_22]